MSTATKWILGLLVGAIVLIGGAVALGITSIIPVRVVTDGTDGDANPQPTEVAAIADGDWFGFVTVGEDEDGTPVFAIDLAEMLTGEPAREAAVEAGVIGEGEDLPNDFFIDNPDQVVELVDAADDVRIILIPIDDTSGQMLVDLESFAAIHDGSWTGAEAYGVIAGTPIAMDITIADGRVSEATAVYLP